MPLSQQPKPREMSWRDPILPTQDMNTWIKIWSKIIVIRNWYYTPIMIIYKSNIFVIEKNSQTSKIESKKGKKKWEEEREKRK